MANNIAGATNAIWGTTNLGLIGTNTNGNYAVLESISITDPSGKPIFTEGRNGTDAIAVMLDNGFDATLKSVLTSILRAGTSFLESTTRWEMPDMRWQKSGATSTPPPIMSTSLRSSGNRVARWRVERTSDP